MPKPSQPKSRDGYYAPSEPPAPIGVSRFDIYDVGRGLRDHADAQYQYADTIDNPAGAVVELDSSVKLLTEAIERLTVQLASKDA